MSRGFRGNGLITGKITRSLEIERVAPEDASLFERCARRQWLWDFSWLCMPG